MKLPDKELIISVILPNNGKQSLCTHCFFGRGVAQDGRAPRSLLAALKFCQVSLEPLSGACAITRANVGSAMVLPSASLTRPPLARRKHAADKRAVFAHRPAIAKAQLRCVHPPGALLPRKIQKSADTFSAEECKQPPPDDCAHDAEDNENRPLTALIDDLAGGEARDQSEKYPADEGTCRYSLCETSTLPTPRAL